MKGRGYLRPRIAVAFLMALASCTPAASPPSWVGPALQLVSERSARAPRNRHGLLDRSYTFQDLDRDGVFEVLEAVPHFEGKLEFMNVELAPAFEWIAVFRYQEGSYREATGQFKSFLRSRRTHYELWLRLVESADSLASDSQRLAQTAASSSPSSGDTSSASTISWADDSADRGLTAIARRRAAASGRRRP